MAEGFIKPEDQEPNIDGFEFYYDAFQELSTARQIGLAVGPIPFTALVEYTRMFEIPDFDDFSHVIRCMDKVYLELNAQENTKPVEKASKPKGKNGRN